MESRNRTASGMPRTSSDSLVLLRGAGMVCEVYDFSLAQPDFARYHDPMPCTLNTKVGIQQRQLWTSPFLPSPMCSHVQGWRWQLSFRSSMSLLTKRESHPQTPTSFKQSSHVEFYGTRIRRPLANSLVVSSYHRVYCMLVPTTFLRAVH